MGFEPCKPRQSLAEIAQWSRTHLEQLVRIDSQSDEASSTIPSTPGQRDLADFVAQFMGSHGASVERDEHANVIASFPGRGSGASLPPMALMAHLDTARGTQAVGSLEMRENWKGDAIPYPANPGLRVELETYPDIADFVGHDILFGPGKAPFGLDDKLGLAHIMTLVRLVESNPETPHPPLLAIGRPDEEIGRMEAVEGLARLLADRGVDFGYTIDGILPFEINVENFNASQIRVTFPHRTYDSLPGPETRHIQLEIGGVNTHGATAKSEGFRAATRFAAELLQRLEAAGTAPAHAVPVRFASDARRDCDAVLTMAIGGTDAPAIEQVRSTVERLLADIVAPHVARGASWGIQQPTRVDASAVEDAATWDMLKFMQSFIDSQPGFVLLAEDSEAREGYSAPFRARPFTAGIHLDVRLRDFETQGLRDREEHVRRVMARFPGAQLETTQQYVNMGPRLAERPELAEWARQAGHFLDLNVRTMPIRGGTGVDPFLDHGVPVANLGTGYFAPESEKEFTSMQMMSQHALWLYVLLQEITAARSNP